MKSNKILEMVGKIDLNKTLVEIREESYLTCGNELVFEELIEIELGIEEISINTFADHNSSIYIRNSGTISLLINKNKNVQNVLNDLDKHIKQMDGLEYFKEEKAGLLAPFIKSKIKEKEKFSIDLMGEDDEN